MQRDFHFGVIKVLARAAGFSESDAQTIAYASQYTDDACEHIQCRDFDGLAALDLDGRVDRWLAKLAPGAPHAARLVSKTGGAFDFNPVCTAHADFDYLEGLARAAQRQVYVSFHFLPAYAYSGSGTYCYRTAHHSAFADGLLDRVVTAFLGSTDASNEVAKCALGIGLHTYADTWAHEGFSGIHSPTDNHLKRVNVDGQPMKPDFDSSVGSLVDIGHAQAGTYPDRISRAVEIHFTRGEVISRSNALHFMGAAEAILDVLSRASRSYSALTWDSVEQPLAECFGYDEAPPERCDRLRAVFSALPGFDGLEMDYDPVEWERHAAEVWMKPGYPTEYGYRSPTTDLRWFDFHVAAAAQQSLVLAYTQP